MAEGKLRSAASYNPRPFAASPSRRWLCNCALGVLAFFLPSGLPHAAAQPRTVFGSAGLVDMPSARMVPDGEFSVSAAFFENTQRYSLNFQALPWLETSFRYNGLTDFNKSFPVLFDRSFGLKVRLWDEDAFLPAIAVGTNDLVGTGIYGGEYVVASKQIGDLDFTLGMGWGRLATANTVRNPFTLLSKSFEARETDYGQGGSFSPGSYFHGPSAGVFGGVSWNTPVEGLTLAAEYSSDRYTQETATGNFTPKSQINLGASYRHGSSVTLGLGWLYGRALYGSIALSIDPTENGFPARIGPALPPISLRSEDERARALLVARDARNGKRSLAMQDLVETLWANADIRDVTLNGRALALQVTRASLALCQNLAQQVAPYAGDLQNISLNNAVNCTIPGTIAVEQTSPILQTSPPPANREPVSIDASGPTRPDRGQARINIRRKVSEQNIVLLALSLTDRVATLYYVNREYASEPEAVDRLLRILMAETPASIETFRFIPVTNGMPQAQIEIPRGTAERSFAQQGSYSIFRDQGSYNPAPMSNPVLATAQRGSYPSFTWSVFPQFRQQLFDPNNPFGVQLLVGAEAIAELLPGLRLMGQFEVNLFNDFRVDRAPDSVLPHVRTDFVKYFSQGKNGIGALELEYNFRLAPSTFVSLKGGYLESMFAGVGGEILWKPEGLRWSLGMDIFHVKQRNFDRLLGLQPYQQTTGHMTLYYESPWYNLDFQFRVGRYLAGDWGTTVQVTRRFASGIEIGVFATKTNVSAAQFGEGSFDKGIVISVPISHLLPINTQQVFAMDLRPVQRDGGQVLAGDAQLYGRLRRASEAEFRRLSGDEW